MLNSIKMCKLKLQCGGLKHVKISDKISREHIKRRIDCILLIIIIIIFHCRIDGQAICLSDTILDSSPNELSDTAEYLELIDTAFFINTSCPPLLRSERKVDVILHLNYSGGSQTLVRLFLLVLNLIIHSLWLSYSFLILNIKKQSIKNNSYCICWR